MSIALDYGTTPARDPRTGDIYLDEDGNVVILEGENLCKQECIVALETVRGEEIFDREYGFPIQQVIKNEFRLELGTLIRDAVLSTLNPNKIFTLQDCNIRSYKYEDGIAYVTVGIVSINGISSELPFGVEAQFR